MARFARDEKEELLDRRGSVFAGLRVVVCDNETTGLNTTTSRIVSVALSEIQQGRVLAGYATLVDPGLSHIGASHIHHITADVLRRAGAPGFELVGPRILERLTLRGEATVALAGYNVAFDALLLNNELVRLGSALPPIQLLEVRNLAQLAQVDGSTLADLAKSLGITATDAHSSIGDTSVTTEALLRLTDQLRAADPDFRIEAHLVPFDPRMRVSRKGVRTSKVADEAPLTPEHAASHDLDLTHKTRREKALRVCVAENCAHLVSRCQDGITDPHRAWQVGEWIGEQLDRDDLTRPTRGRLITALAMAAGSTDDADYIRATFDWVEARLPGWGPCTPADQCDRCADDAGRTCRYLAVRYALVAAFLYQDDELSVPRAQEFLPYHVPGTKRGRGRPPTGWFGCLVRAGDLDTAGYGAQLVAQAGPLARTPGFERGVLALAWDAGSRNAKLADRYSNRILADGSPDPARPHLAEAEQVCVEGLALRNGSKADVFDRLQQRLERIRIRIANPPRPAPSHTRNGRTPRTNVLQAR